MNCVSRLIGQAFITTVCIGGTAMLLYLIVKLARTRNISGLVPVCAMLVFWVGISVLVYPRFCAELVPWLLCGGGAPRGALPPFTALRREPPVRHSTCPVCRRDVFELLPAGVV